MEGAPASRGGFRGGRGGPGGPMRGRGGFGDRGGRYIYCTRSLTILSMYMPMHITCKQASFKLASRF